MRVSLKSVLSAAVAMSAMAFSASAASVPISSTVAESGSVTLQNQPSYPLTGTPYDFTGQVNAFSAITSIDSLTVTLTVTDGDSDVGEFDHGNLTLALDGTDTGLKLDGFSNNNVVTLSLNTLSPALQSALIASLADGKLVGSVNDAAHPNQPGDVIGFPTAIDTTLDLTVSGPTLTGPGGNGGNPVPLPAAVVLAPLGAGLAGIYSRRFRNKK
jgi:hypothetical protein